MDSPNINDDDEDSLIIDDSGMYGFFRSYYEGASGEEETNSILTR